jgi:hypothetical protein
MSAFKVMIIRHAEKPADHHNSAPPFGVDPEGRPDPHSLSPLGWQRAGALTPWFATPWAAGIARPAALFAPHRRGTSDRGRQTILPLAERLGLEIRADHAVGEEDRLARAVLAAHRPVLIAWEHKMLPHLPRLLAGAGLRTPEQWPAERFDIAWVLDRDPAGGWRFTQVPQLLLAGDRPEAIG